MAEELKTPEEIARLLVRTASQLNQVAAKLGFVGAKATADFILVHEGKSYRVDLVMRPVPTVDPSAN